MQALAGVVQEIAVVNTGRAEAFAITTRQAVIQMLPKLVGESQLIVGEGLHQGDTATRGLVFVLKQAVGRTVGQA